MMLRVFISYAHEDEPLLKELKSHLALLQNGVITTWHDRDIGAGTEWEDEIDSHLNTAHIILLLISASFFASDYCYSREMKRALERQKAGQARVIPIILRPVNWKGAPFGRLRPLPTDARPITSWPNRDDGFVDVEKGIRDAIEKLMIQLHPRVIALFGYEAQGGRTSILWSDPGAFSLNETCLEWLQTKRGFREGEIVDHTWVKVGDNGYAFINRFIAGGKLFEWSLFDPSTEWQGSWELIDGMLRTSINHNGIYKLDVLASQDGSMYSGVSSKEGQKALNAYAVLLPSQRRIAERGDLRVGKDTGLYENALTAYDQILLVNPSCVEAYKAKGDILRDLGRYTEALIAYEQALLLYPDSASAYEGKGWQLHLLKRDEEAHIAYEQALLRDSDHAEWYNRKAIVLRTLERREEALTVHEQASKLAPEVHHLYIEKGITFRDLKRYEEALAAFERALQLNPNSAHAYNERGMAFRELGEYEKALTDIKKAIDLDHDYMHAYRQKGITLHEYGHHEHNYGYYEEAIAAFDQAIRLDLNYADTYARKGDTLYELKKYKEALNAYERAQEREDQPVSFWVRKGEMLYALERYQEAVTAYETALQLDPECVDAYLGLGRAYLRLKSYEEALAVYEQATKVAPDNTWIWHDKGEALSRLGRAGDALVAFEQALVLDSTNRWAWRHKSEALEQLAQQAAQRANQLSGEEEQSISEIVDESNHRVKPDAKGTAIYSIVSEFSEKVLDIPAGAQEDGTVIIQYHYHGGLNQQWELVPVEDNFFKIVSCLNGKVLDVWNHNREDGAEVVLHRYLGGSNQHWQLVLIDSASFTFKIISQESGKVLDVWNSGREDGNKVVLHRYLGGSNQHWRLTNAQQWNEELASELAMSLLRYNYHDAAGYLDEVRNRLGLPLTPALEATPSLLGTPGRVQRFAGGSDDPQGASVYSSKYGTYPTWGWIAERYESCGGTNGRLGFPISPELKAMASPQGTTGQVQRFEGGPHDAWPVGGDEWDYSKGVSVYASTHGAYPVWGGIGRCYEPLGGTGSVLGFPASSEREAMASPQDTTGWIQRFEGGDMYWTEEYDGVPVREPILTLFEKSGGSGGKFGFPKLPAIPDPVHSGHYTQEFEGGVIQSYD